MQFELFRLIMERPASTFGSRPVTSASSRTPVRQSRLTARAPATSRLPSASRSRPSTGLSVSSSSPSGLPFLNTNRISKSEEFSRLLEMSIGEQQELVEQTVAHDLASFPAHLRSQIGHKLIDSALATLRKQQLRAALRQTVQMQIKRATEPELIRQSALLTGLQELDHAVH